MTLESCTEFATKIGSDEKIAEQAATATTGLGSIQERAEAITKLGAEHGFVFSVEEALSAFIAVRQASNENVELTEEELGFVAGGLSAEQRLQQLLFRPTGGDVKAGAGHYINYMKFILG